MNDRMPSGANQGDTAHDSDEATFDLSRPDLSSPDLSSFAFVDLVFRVDELLAHLGRALDEHDARNAALFASGALQAIDDDFTRTSGGLTRALGFFSQRSSRLRKPIASLQKARLHWLFLKNKNRIRDVRKVLWGIVTDCALADLNGEDSTASTITTLKISATSAISKTSRDVELLRESLSLRTLRATARIPSCFRGFDQHPRDVERLVERYVEDVRSEDRKPRATIVVGVRTSGSYLAPYVAAALRRHSIENVFAVSARAEVPLLLDDEKRLRDAASEGVSVLVVDDPPASGYALRAVCERLEAHGVSHEEITLLLGVFSDSSVLPDCLKKYHSYVIPQSEWDIWDRLSPQKVQELARIVMQDKHAVIERYEPLEKDRLRGHVSVLATATDSDGQKHTLVLQGVGIGYFGEHELAVARALQRYSPRTYGVYDGVLVIEIPADAVTHLPTAQTVVKYLAERVEKLSVTDDKSLGLSGSQPVWEVASEALARVYGRFWPIARMVYIDRVIFYLLRSKHHVVVDKTLCSDRWLETSTDVVKLGLANSAFDSRDLVCYDPAYDAVIATVDGDAQRDAAHIRHYFSERIETVSPEKWLLYSLVKLWDMERDIARNDLHARAKLANKKSTVFRQYFADALFANVATPTHGSLVALDIDGVIETRVMGFNAPTPGSARSIHALLKHGYQVVVVTGRCVDDVKELVRLFRLNGGVAEYGSVFVAADGTETSLVDDVSRGALCRLRSHLARHPKVHIDERSVASVRAQFRITEQKTGPLPIELIEKLRCDGLLDGIVQFPGELQTDFVSATVDKATGLEACCQRLGETTALFAIGDTDADVSMLSTAYQSGVPAHASDAARNAATYIAKMSYQAGVIELISTLLGHRPNARRCECCTPTEMLSDDTQLLLRILATTEGNRAAILPRTLATFWYLSKCTRRSTWKTVLRKRTQK